MKTSDKTRALQSLVDDISNGRITFDNYLQRKAGQWSLIQKSKLIDSIVRGYPIPPVYAVEADSKTISVIDGCQRLTTIADYVNGEFALSSEILDIAIGADGKTDVKLKRKKFTGLPEELQRKIKNAEIIVITLSDYSNDELVDVFDRLNGGTPLSTAQKSKVYMSFELAGMISRMADTKGLKNTGISDMQVKRDENQTIIIQAMMLLNAKYATSGFGKLEIKKFLLAESDAYDATSMSKLADMIDSLDILFPEKNPACKKSMVAPILYAIEPIYTDKVKMKKFKVELDKFLIDPSTYADYTMYAARHTTSATNVRGRAEFFKKMAIEAASKENV